MEWNPQFQKPESDSESELNIGEAGQFLINYSSSGNSLLIHMIGFRGGDPSLVKFLSGVIHIIIDDEKQLILIDIHNSFDLN